TDFSSGWTASLGTSTGWGYGKTTSGIPILVNPVDYGNSNYAPSTDDRIWTDFTFAPGTQLVALNYYLQGRMASGDYLNSGVAVGGNTDPFAGSGTQLQHETDTLSSPAAAYPIDQCAGKTCSIGFQLTSKPTSTGNTGPLIAFFELNTVAANTREMGIENGTSMAAPVVSGIAALLMASDPAASDIDVARAIKNSGIPVPALTGVTTTGKAVNAMRALANLHLSVTGLADRTGTAGQPLSVTFSISGLNALAVSASSSNTSVLANTAITGQNSCTQTGGCTLQLLPAMGGTSTIYVTVSDTFGQQATGSFLLTVPSSSGGGGGGMNWSFLLVLAVILAAVQWRRRGLAS
ncbi:MAG: hypothetical protein B7X29_08810, partial [Halothiobacillus sp. 13-55-115]